MTAKTTFYILKEASSPKERDLYACRIIEKAYNNKHKIYIHTPPGETQNFDKQLWTFRDISFIPHEIYIEGSNQNIQILIGDSKPPSTQNDILVNLTTEIAPFFQGFNHIIEVIPNDENLKNIGRKKYQSYKKEKRQIETFNI